MRIGRLHLSWRHALLLLALLGCAGLLYPPARRYGNALLCQWLPPIEDATERAPAFSHADQHGDALLVVDPAAMERSAQAGRYSAVDWSNAWANTLLQEVGCWDTTEPSKLDPTGRMAIVVTRSCGSAAMDAAKLERWVRAGGVLVVEVPNQALAELAGVEVDPTPVWASRITNADWLGAKDPFPIRCRRWKISGAAIEPNTRVKLDDQDVIALRRLGEGAVISVAMDYGSAMVAWQQGVPEEDFTVREKRGSVPGVVESDDLVMDDALMHNPIPAANLLARRMMGAVREIVPLPGWWPIPEGKSAAILMTHDDEGEGEKPLHAMLEEERKAGVRATVFAIPDVFVGEWSGSPADVELHWSRYLFSDLQRHRFDEQHRRHGASISRLHYLDWGREWDGPWGAMGYASDASLGPNNGWGYCFASGLPYLTVDRRGRLLLGYEMPFQMQETWGGASAERFRDMAELASHSHHTGIVLSFHADRSVSQKAGRELWTAAMTQARASAFWTGGLSEWLMHSLWFEGRGIRSTRIGPRTWQFDDLGAWPPGFMRIPWSTRIRRATIGGRPADVVHVNPNTALCRVPGGARIRVTYAP